MPTHDQEWLEFAQPLLDEHTKLTAELAALDAQRETLAARMRRIDGAVKSLTAEKKKPGYTGVQRIQATEQEVVDAVRGFIESHNGNYADGFTKAHVFRDIRTTGAAPAFGQHRINAAVAVLHEQGVIRLDRKGRGGAQIYKLVSA